MIDDRLGVRVIASRALVYPRPAGDDLAHVRAASGLAAIDGVLHVIQDDAAYVARIDAATLAPIDAIALPGDGPRRFEDALGNRLAKPDFEACVVVDGELVGFGSGTVPARERMFRIGRAPPIVIDGAAIYAAVRAAIGSPINLEGAARVGKDRAVDELWLFHRGNTGPDDPGPAAARLTLAAFRAWRDHGEPPVITAVDRHDLGTTAGVRLGFTDADAIGTRVVYAAAAEAAPDAITDGAIVDAALGVIADGAVRACPLRLDGVAVKAEGVALDPRDPSRAWIVVDRDDPEIPSMLYALELTGPW